MTRTPVARTPQLKGIRKLLGYFRKLQALGIELCQPLDVVIHKGDLVPGSLSHHPVNRQFKNLLKSPHRAFRGGVEAAVCLRNLGNIGIVAGNPVQTYLEELYRHLMGALIRLDRQREAAAVYEDMSKLFMSSFGVMPEESTRAVYREALSALQDPALPVDSILEHLREPEGPGGALICQYDIFRSIYHSVARSLVRSGDAVHLALFSVHNRSRGEALPRRSLDRAMDNLQEIIRTSLRRGDVAARCSVSQFILMLPQANFENSQMVCDRILRAFSRKFPHSPALPQAAIFPLEPN